MSPRIRAALATITSPPARRLPHGWAEALHLARHHLSAAADVLRAGIPTEPGEPEWWKRGLPIAGALQSEVHADCEGVLATIDDALAKLSIERAVELATGYAEALARGEWSHDAGADRAELLGYADAVRRRRAP